MAIAPARFRELIAQRQTQRDPNVFDQVVAQISGRLYRQVQTTVTRPRGQHVVEKTFTRGNRCLICTFALGPTETKRDLRFPRITAVTLHPANSVVTWSKSTAPR